jgi:hypothetical protein
MSGLEQMGAAPDVRGGRGSDSLSLGFQKEAIAAEKHVLASGSLRSDPEPMAVSPPDDEQSRDAGATEQALPSDDEAEAGDRLGRRLWMYVILVAIAVMALGCGLIAYLWPELPAAVMSF